MSDETNHLSLIDIFMINNHSKVESSSSSTSSDDDDDNLSFCDLPKYNSNTNNSNSNFVESQSFSSGNSLDSESSNTTSSSLDTEDEGELFQFFSEEWNKNKSLSVPPDNFVFCGKLISSKKEESSLENDRNSENQIGSGSRFLRFINRSKTSSSRSSTKGVSTKKNREPSSKLDSYPSVKEDYAVRNLSMKKPPLSSSSSRRSKWQLMFFGFSRTSTNAEFRNTRNNSKNLRSCGGGESEMVSDGGGGAGRRIMWALIRTLSCGVSHHSLGDGGGDGGVDGFGPSAAKM